MMGAGQQKAIRTAKGKGATPLAKVSFLSFVGMTCALALTVRNIPDVASTGWTMFFYMAVSALLFGFPIVLLAGELATTYPEDGGVELWAENTLGGKWGYVVSWLSWVQLFPGMVMVASVLAPMLGYVMDRPDLATSNLFTLACILVVYWLVTVLNMKFDMAKIGGKFGIWVGLYIPILMLFVLGVASLLKMGISPASTLGTFSPEKLIPDGQTAQTLSMFAPIIMIFIGIEMSSVYIRRLRQPRKEYARGAMLALLLMFLFNVVCAFLVAAFVPSGEMQLNNITQALAIYVQVLGLPGWVVPLFALMVLVGAIVELSGWVSGPSSMVVAVARRGLYPPKWRFWRAAHEGLSIRVSIVQACMISLFAVIYLLIPDINGAFLMLVNAASVLYCIVYIIMAVGFIRMRLRSPELNHPFRIGKRGNGLGIAVAVTLIVVTVGVNVLTFLYSSAVNNLVVSAITIVLFAAPLVIYRLHSSDWAEQAYTMMVGYYGEQRAENLLQDAYGSRGVPSSLVAPQGAMPQVAAPRSNARSVDDRR